ncbi:hypothetical protein ANO14919_087740 [Xylariales sp. No.14919]|nr:hypothetical protein ANO14919_087740 [Xylariales sp. No.14919]
MAWGFYTQLHYGGFFVNQWNVRFRDLEKIIPSALIFSILYAVTMVFAKPAILLEWTHIFVLDREHSAFYRLAHTIIILHVLLYVSGIIADTTTCIPLSALWEPWIRGKCINKKVLDIAGAYFNLAVDVFILILPQRIIWNLHMPKNKKIGVSIIFSFGILSIVCAAGRIYSNHKVEYAGEGDTNYTLSEVYLWAFPEVSCVLLVFNITAVPRLLPETWTSLWLPACFRYWTTVYSRKKSVENHELPVIWPRPVDGNGLVSDYTQAQLTVPRPTIPIRLDTTYRGNPNQAGVSYFRRTESESSDDIIIQRPGSFHIADVSRQHIWIHDQVHV